MSTRTCAACPAKLRKGTGKKMLILSQHAGEWPAWGIVCPRCQERATLLVLPSAPGEKRSTQGRQCAGCPGRVRKGVGRKALVLRPPVAPRRPGEVKRPGEDGPKVGVVCPACVMRGLWVVVPPATTLAPPCKACGGQNGRAAYCAVCHGGVCENVAALTATNAALVTEREGAER